MNAQHPITPPPELVEEWRMDYIGRGQHWFIDVAKKIVQWGSDRQLAEDAKWLDQHALDAPHLKITPVGKSLIEAMRPKPPSLKEQALEALGPEPLPETGPTGDTILNHGAIERHRFLRRALEALPE